MEEIRLFYWSVCFWKDGSLLEKCTLAQPRFSCLSFQDNKMRASVPGLSYNLKFRIKLVGKVI